MDRKDELVDFINSELLTYKSVVSEEAEKSNIKSMLSNMPIIDNDIVSDSYDLEDKGINYYKLKLLLDNIDDILLLIKKEDKSKVIRSGNTKVTSLRVDIGIYEQIKNKAVEDNINISEIINIALEDYLKKY
ncbi:hypothetical protein KQI30_10430 [Clostridium bornimense]|uniref:hypothetical protein n=1 Tax=Clostridium bornimense TaxID=1216932 RepID=UPI001C122137|nr:hypothetical protein [Clostridium bornimense]MBU5316686.1 hypothetical protein [Clostridium bornimense]